MFVLKHVDQPIQNKNVYLYKYIDLINNYYIVRTKSNVKRKSHL